jgi:hypothetical protein
MNTGARTMRILKKLLGLDAPPRNLTEEQVLDIARRTVSAEGWPWREPVIVGFNAPFFRRHGQWEVFTNAHYMGGNVIIRIDDVTGEVVGKYLAPR